MGASVSEISGAMTIAEAATQWPDERREKLKLWVDKTGTRLQDLGIWHLQAYERERGEVATASEIDAEVDALLALLATIGLGDEVRLYYRPLCQEGQVTAAEIKALPEPVRRYIQKLQQEISDLRAGNERMNNHIRRTNWGRNR
jgi:hypothetical protein